MYYVILRRNGQTHVKGAYSADFMAYAKAARLRKSWPYSVVEVEMV